MIALVLSAFATVLAAVVAPKLARARWVLRCPGLGVLAWQMLTHAVLVSALLVGLTALLHRERGHNLVCAVWQICLDALFGAHGAAAQLLAALGLLLVGVMTTRLAMAAVALAVGERRVRRRILTMMRLTGRQLPLLGVTVVPSPHPAACLVPGRPADVMVTSGALRRLSDAELQAITAHERAHAQGRHYWLTTAVRLPVRAFPRLRVFDHAHRQVRRLVELRADEVAARANSSLTLATALLTMAEATAIPSAARPTLRADGGNTAERLDRLLRPPAPLHRVTAAVTAAGLLMLPVLPVALAILNQFTIWSMAPLWPF